MKLISFLFISSLLCWPITSLATQPSKPKASYHPIKFVEEKLSKRIQQLEKRQMAKFKSSIKISSEITRNDWLKNIYKVGLIEASELQRDLGDKLFMYKMLKEILTQEKAEIFHPKTMGIKELFIKNNLIDKNHQLIKDIAKIKAAIKKEFPKGWIVKPASNINSQGLFYFKNSKFFKDLLDPKVGSQIYSSKQFTTPFFSKALNSVGTGEAYIFQENVILAAGYQKIRQAKEFIEIRVHTLEDKVIQGGAYSRWKEIDEKVNPKDIKRASDFVQQFLNSLPKKFLAKMAFGIDVAVLDNGALRLIEINTNRGRYNKQWSGYIARPKILGAYTRHIEKHYPIRISGLSGFIFRNNLGSLHKYFKKRYIEGIN